LERRRRERTKQSRKTALEAFRRDPVGYAQRVLRVEWWDKQKEIARAIVEHRKVFVQASHDVGKTFLSGGIVNWHFDCFNPGKTLTTAPTQHQVIDLTWGEVRSQRRTKPRLLPKAPRIESYTASGELDPNHYASGYTARDANAFQGVHEEHVLIIFEEAVGVGAEFWLAAEGMLSSGADNKWLAIMNPTDTGSAAYQYLLEGGWEVITVSALEHPNLLAELMGWPKPFPKAISLEAVQEHLAKWCTRVEAGDTRVGDFCWPYELVDCGLREARIRGDRERIEFLEAQRIALAEHWESRGGLVSWHRPGPLFESRVLGRWPSQSIDSVWSQAAWEAAITPHPELQEEELRSPIEIGCDVAWQGDDYTAFHVRRGPVSLHHEEHNGWSPYQSAGRLKGLAQQFAQVSGQDARKIVVKIDDDGVGNAVVQLKENYNFQGLSAALGALEPENYPNRRSEMWFAVAERAAGNRLDLSRLSPGTLKELRRQAMAPKWTVDSQGRRVVERKPETKNRIKRSPDDMDALNLAYAPSDETEPAIVLLRITSDEGVGIDSGEWGHKSLVESGRHLSTGEIKCHNCGFEYTAEMASIWHCPECKHPRRNR
jgi:predicted Zn-ribbon and HTH transcriptional regulator